jgi:hypothetical protein
MGLLLGQEFFLKDLVFLFYLTLFAIFVFVEIRANILFYFHIPFLLLGDRHAEYLQSRD